MDLRKIQLYDNILMLKQDLHIGHLIKAVFDESGLSVAELARRIGCERTNVYSIFERSDISIRQLVAISQALQHNFLDDVQYQCELKTTLPARQLTISFDTLSPRKAERISVLLNRLADEVKTTDI